MQMDIFVTNCRHLLAIRKVCQEPNGRIERARGRQTEREREEISPKRDDSQRFKNKIAL